MSELLYTQEDIDEWIRTCEELQERNRELKKEIIEYQDKIKLGELIEISFTDKDILEDYAHRMFDSWNDITGAIYKGCSWYGEALSVIDDIVGMVYGITKRQIEKESCSLNIKR